MAANSKTSTQPDPETDGTRRRRGSEFADTSTRRESHGPPPPPPRFSPGGRSESTSTELVPYTPSSGAKPAPRNLRAQLTQLYHSATLSVHRMQNRPPK